MIGEKIKLLRVEKGIKQEELAKALHVSQKAISHYETGRVTPPLATSISVQVYAMFDSKRAPS